MNSKRQVLVIRTEAIYINTLYFLLSPLNSLDASSQDRTTDLATCGTNTS